MEDWKVGRHNDNAIVPIVRGRTAWAAGRRFAPYISAHTSYTITLQDAFREQGLRVPVEVGSIELTPETNPAYADDDCWLLPGQLNEHIVAVAVAVFAFHAENITEPGSTGRNSSKSTVGMR